jgi:hypothetical protein
LIFKLFLPPDSPDGWTVKIKISQKGLLANSAYNDFLECTHKYKRENSGLLKLPGK